MFFFFFQVSSPSILQKPYGGANDRVRETSAANSICLFKSTLPSSQAKRSRVEQDGMASKHWRTTLLVSPFSKVAWPHCRPCFGKAEADYRVFILNLPTFPAVGSLLDKLRPAKLGARNKTLALPPSTFSFQQLGLGPKGVDTDFAFCLVLAKGSKRMPRTGTSMPRVGWHLSPVPGMGCL